MSDPIELYEISSDAEARFLMPGQGTHLHLVLFCAADSPTVQKAQALAADHDLPPNWRLVHLVPDSAPQTTRWFGLSERAGMAAIYDGSMLSVEYECSLDAFRRLLKTARRQQKSLQELG